MIPASFFIRRRDRTQTPAARRTLTVATQATGPIQVGLATTIFF